RLRLEARTFLKRLQRELGTTTVFVTHDQAEALALADRIAVMEAGTIRQLGTPREVFRQPANTFTANFIGSTPMNLLSAAIRDGQVEVAGQRAPIPARDRDHVSEGQEVVYGVRPEYVTLSRVQTPGALRGTVSIVENLGSAALVSVDCDGQIVGVTVPEGDEPDPGAEVWLTTTDARTLLYRADDGELVGSPREPASSTQPAAVI
ncbi:MAG: ABC transporter ATP-binding protein, partial [Micromonosporaceae bacterium]